MRLFTRSNAAFWTAGSLVVLISAASPCRGQATSDFQAIIRDTQKSAPDPPPNLARVVAPGTALASEFRTRHDDQPGADGKGSEGRATLHSDGRRRWPRRSLRRSQLYDGGNPAPELHSQGLERRELRSPRRNRPRPRHEEYGQVAPTSNRQHAWSPGTESPFLCLSRKSEGREPDR